MNKLDRSAERLTGWEVVYDSFDLSFEKLDLKNGTLSKIKRVKDTFGNITIIEEKKQQ